MQIKVGMDRQFFIQDTFHCGRGFRGVIISNLCHNFPPETNPQSLVTTDPDVFKIWV